MTLVRFAARRLLGALLSCACAAASGGQLGKADIERYFPAPLIVGEKDPKLATWPLLLRDDRPGRTAAKLDPLGRTVWPVSKPGEEPLMLVGYAFETNDVNPVPGYSGKLINSLVALDDRGNFIDVRLISHREPIFAGGLADQLLGNFASQYRGISVRQSVRILNSDTRQAPKAPPGVVFVNGVARGTVTVELMDKAIMQSASKIAFAKLGIVSGNTSTTRTRLRTDFFEPSDWDGLARAGLVQRKVLTNREIEQPFAATPAAGQDPDAIAHPDDPAIDLRFAWLSLPQVGRNLLDEPGWAKIETLSRKGEQSLLVAWRGRYSLLGDEFQPAGAPDRLALRQGERVIELRDFIFDNDIKLPAGFERKNARVIRIAGYGGADAAQPLQFDYRIKRIHGTFNKQRFDMAYPFEYRLPASFVALPPPDEPAWMNTWRNRRVDLAILAAGLLVLTIALAGQRWLVKTGARLTAFRLVFLVFTLGFIGWYGQGQLSIVNLTSVIEAGRLGNSFEFLLFDPMSVALWAFVLVTLFIWGRGTFCGWLCPFGALQELISMVTKRLGIKPRKFHTTVDARLKWIKYGVLAAILGAAATSSAWTERAIEVEPFKTAISLHFVRDWPYVAGALAAVLLSVFVYRGYCRYICPLGAALAVLGWARIFKWIPRRAECGTPCQTCRYRCEYQAIEPTGTIAYQECFQCLECVEIHDSDEQCAPLIVAGRKNRPVIPLHPQPLMARTISRGAA